MFRKIDSITNEILLDNDILYLATWDFFIIATNTQEEWFSKKYPDRIYFRHYEIQEILNNQFMMDNFRMIISIKRLFHHAEIVPKILWYNTNRLMV
jgi:hypothetical protein